MIASRNDNQDLLNLVTKYSESGGWWLVGYNLSTTAIRGGIVGQCESNDFDWFADFWVVMNEELY